MGSVAKLSQPAVQVEPGRSVTFGLTVRNTGTVVDRFSFEALGPLAPWVTFAPATVSLFPQASGIVNVSLAPPRDPAMTAGAVPLGIRVSSAEDPGATVVEETTVYVAPFSDVTMELVPRIARGRVTGRTQLAVDNRSNCTYRGELAGTDPQDQVGFAFRPPIVDVAPGAAVFVKVGLRPRRRFWKGHDKTIPFRLTLTNEPVAIPVGGQAGLAHSDTAGLPEQGQTPVGPAGRATTATATATATAVPTGPAQATTGSALAAPTPPSPHPEEIFADGSLLQGPILPRWLLTLVAALVGLAVLLLILWFALFRPQIRSTAQNEVNKQLSANGITATSPAGNSKGAGKTGASGAGKQSGASQKATGPNGSNQSGGTSSSGTGGSGGGGNTTLIGTGGTINKVRQASGNGTYVVFAVPQGRTLQVTDLLVENSTGEAGDLTLALNGTPVMQWAMANFRDLDYHWITPTVFGPGSQVQMIVSGCSGTCTPAIYAAGHLVSS